MLPPGNPPCDPSLDWLGSILSLGRCLPDRAVELSSDVAALTGELRRRRFRPRRATAPFSRMSSRRRTAARAGWTRGHRGWGCRGDPDLSSPAGWKRRRGGGEGRRLRRNQAIPGADPVFPRVDQARRAADLVRAEPNRRRSPAADRRFLILYRRRRRSALGVQSRTAGGALREGRDGGRAARESAGRPGDRGPAA